MRVAVVGGGLFGVTAAMELAEAGMDVDLFEKSDDIMQAASQTNMFRLHRGYHYPRSESTALECRDAASQFREWFPGAVVQETEHYYAIAGEESKTSPAEFIEHCERLDLEYDRADLGLVSEDAVDLTVKVPENRIDPAALRAESWRRMRQRDVDVHLNTEVGAARELAGDYDFVVVAAYASTNEVLDGYPSLQTEYEFQLCEEVLVDLPPSFHNKSLVVLDGPFMCFDPFGRTDRTLLYDVVHSIHQSNIGQEYDIDESYAAMLNQGVIEQPSITNFEEFIEHGTEFIPKLSEAEHLGSMYTVRTILPYREDTDERPTIVERKDNVFKILSGKLCTSVQAAETVRNAITQ